MGGMYHIKDSTGACLHDGLGFADCSNEQAQTWSFAGDVDVIRSSTKDRCIQAEVGGEWGEVTLENCTNSNPGQQWTVTNQNQLSATVNGCTDFQSAQRGLSAQWGEGCCLERLDSTVKLWSCDEYYTQIWSFESIQGPAPITGPAPSDTCAEIGCDADYHDELPCQCDSNCLSFDNCCSDFFRVAVVMTHVLKSVVVPTTARTFHVSAIRIVAAMATAARTLRRLAVVHALKSVVMLTTAMTFHVSATTIVKTMATAVSTTKQGVE